MKPYQLIAALVDATYRTTGKSATQIATEMSKRSFQGTLHKFINGNVPNPSRATALAISKYWDLPLDALYDEAVATREAQRLGLTGGALQIAEPTALFVVPSSTPSRLSASIEARMSHLNAEQIKHLEAIITGYLDAVVPTTRQQKRRS